MNSKFNLLLGVLMLWQSSIMAQMTFVDSAKARFDSLQPYVPTGLLAERSPLSYFLGSTVSNPQRLNGIGDTAIDKRIWTNLHRNLYHMAYSPSYMKFHPAAFDSLLEIERYGQSRAGMTVDQLLNLMPQNDIVLGFIDREFNMITAEAWDSAYIRSDTNSLMFTLNVGYFHLRDTIFADTIYFSTHPDSILVLDTMYYRDPDSILPRTFSNHRSLALGALHYQAYATGANPSIDIAIPPIFSMPLAGKSYEVDFDDGQGFRPWPNAAMVQVNYTSYGEKTITLRTPNTGVGSDTLPYLVTKSGIKITELKQGEPDERISLPNQFADVCPLSYADYGIGKGVGFVKYRKNAGSNPKLHKPVIIVEGLETANTRTPVLDNGDYYGFGDLNWRAFSSGDFGTVAPQLSEFPYFMDSLRNAGYDVIVLDLLTNRAPIQQNGNLLINLIQYVNNQLDTSQSDEEIVLIGASMGGLIARWGTRKMEMEGCCHNIRLFTTFSTPHQGANIPIGLQEFLYAMGHGQNILGNGDNAKKLYDNALNSPVARQMLVYHRENSASAERAAFVAQLDSMGFPEDCRLAALTNGSGTGRGQQANNEAMTGRFLTGGDAMLTIHEKIWAPVSLPDNLIGAGIIDILNIVDVMQGQSGNDWTMVNAEAYAVSSSSGPSNQLVLKRGDQSTNNLRRWLTQLATYALGMAGLYKINLVHISLYALALALFCTMCAQVTFSKLIANAITIATFTAIMVVHQAVNEDINTSNSQHYRYINNYPTLAYDNAPGDYNITQETIRRESDGKADNHDFGHHNFIATVSALAIDTNDLFLNVRNFLNFNPEGTPFEFVYFNTDVEELNSVNQRHVEITANNMAWLMQVIRTTDNPTQVQPIGQTWNLDKYYNYGEPQSNMTPSRFLEDTYINAGGALHVNHYGNVGYTSSSYGSTVQGSFFQVKTAKPNCHGAHVVINNQGEFIIGDNGLNANRGEAVFQRNGILEIKSGGTLKVHQDSRLLIEPGGQLIIHPGANVILVDSNSVLELQGRLTLKQGTVFSPEGEGFVRFNQTGLLPSDWPNLLTYEANTQMHFTGNSMNDKRVEVRMNTSIFDNLDSLIFTNCRVEMAEEVFFAIHSSMNSTGSHFTSIDPQLPAIGLRLYGQDNVHIDQSRFSHCQKGIYANLLTYGHPLAISASKFDYNDVGLKVVGKNFTVNQCDFFDNTIGLEGQNIDGVSQVKNGDFRDNTQDGISVVGQHGSALRVSESHIEHSDKGVSATGTSLQVWCNTWDDNDIGIFAEEGEILMGRPQGHNNYFHNNRMDLHFYELDRLRFREGFNSLSGWYRYMTGSFSGNATNYLHYNNLTSGYELDVKNNDLPAISGFVPISLFLNSQQVVIHNWGPLSLVSTLCSQASPSISGLTDCCFKTSFNVNVTGLGTLPLDSAILSAVGYLDNDQMTTINYLKDIIEYVDNNNYCYPEMSECSGEVMEDLDILVLRDAYQFYLVALSNAYRHGHIELNRAEPEGPLSSYLSFIIDETDYRIEHEVPLAAEPGDLEFYYNLSKAHAYRMGEHYDEALSILNDESLWHSTREIEQAAYWSCVCEAEKDLILEELSPDDFSYALEACRNHISQKKSRSIPDFGGIDVRHLLAKQAWSAEILPNPSNGFSELHFSSPTTGRGDYEIMATSGTRVASGSIPEGVNSIPLKLTLPAGLYTLRITMSDHDTRSLKWVVR